VLALEWLNWTVPKSASGNGWHRLALAHSEGGSAIHSAEPVSGERTDTILLKLAPVV
jgi:hypothetical protein